MMIAGRREDKLRELAAQYTGESPLLVQAADVADRDSVGQLFDRANRELGRVDILIHSAGVNVQKRSMEELAPEDWDRL